MPLPVEYLPPQRHRNNRRVNTSGIFSQPKGRGRLESEHEAVERHLYSQLHANSVKRATQEEYNATQESAISNRVAERQDL